MTYGLLRAKNANAKFKEIIAVAFYSPPNSKKKSELLDNLITNCHVLMMRYPRAVLVIGGDRNELSISPLLQSIPRLRQINGKNTCNGKVLDVLLMNIPEYYLTPEVVPPVPADDPRHGAPSDHSTVIATPVSHTEGGQIINEYTIRTARPLPDSGILEFGQWVTSESWDCLDSNQSTDEQVAAMQELMTTKMDSIFPTKQVKLSLKDKPYITCQLKQLERQKMREYRKHGKSERYSNLKSRFDKKLKKAANDHLDKNVRLLKESDPGKAFSTLKKMGARPGECLDEGSFTLTNHIENNLTNQESVEVIANHFALISQEYPPLAKESLPQRIRDKLNSISNGLIPKLEELEVYEMISKAKKPKSGVPGDLPRTLVKEFGVELSTPLTKIYNSIISSGVWPMRWKVEYGIPLKKVANPVSEDELRIISLTAFYSKTFERFVMDWLLKYIGPMIDQSQYGGLKGSSVTHYLIDFINFVLYNQDVKDIHAVLVVAVDFSKAFNRQNHNLLIELLSDLGVPGWLLRIIMGFLENREMEVTYKGTTSGRKKLPGGGPQGTLLGMFLFLILINAAGFKDNLKETGKIITKPFNRRGAMPKIHLKYIDDMTIAEAIDLKKKLVENPDKNPPKPLQYHERTGHVFPEGQSEVQAQLQDLEAYCENYQMKLNPKKSKVILFNSSRKYDFMPSCHFGQNENLEVVEELKLLGVTIKSNLSWSAHCDQICRTAYARMWMLRRLKPLGATSEELIDIYEKQIRCILEFAVPAWNPGLTKAQINQVERVQKCALAIILEENYQSYQSALKKVHLITLSERRYLLSLNFAKKAVKHDIYSNWFTPSASPAMNTRSIKPTFKPVQARLARYLKSPISYLTKLLNSQK